MISEEQIKNLADKWAIDKLTITREYVQLIFLNSLYEVTGSNHIYFKGGTAIRLLFSSNRFSEDLDFTTDISPDKLKDILEKALTKSSLFLTNLQIKNLKVIEGRSLAAILSYFPKELKFSLNIKLEFSFREKALSPEVTILETEFPNISHTPIYHLSWSEILAEKIRTVLSRRKGRDIYDLYLLLLRGIEVNWNFVDKKLKYYQITGRKEEILQRIKNFDDKQLKNDLNQFLSIRDRKIIPVLKDLVIKQIKQSIKND